MHGQENIKIYLNQITASTLTTFIPTAVYQWVLSMYDKWRPIFRQFK